MNEATLRALYELISSAEETVPVFDVLSGHGWKTLNAFDRRERLIKAIAAMRESLVKERVVSIQKSPTVLVQEDGFVA